MKNHTAAIALMLLVGITSTRASPQSVKHAPDFSLMISTQNQTIPKDTINLGVAIEVVERNTSHHDVNVSRPNYPGRWYKMSVVREEGTSADITDEYRHVIEPHKDPDSFPNMDSQMGVITPGHSQHWAIALTNYVDLSKPGKYKITFSRGTDPGEPDSVEVKSNTITLTVTK